MCSLPDGELIHSFVYTCDGVDQSSDTDLWKLCFNPRNGNLLAATVGGVHEITLSGDRVRVIGDEIR